MDISIFDLSNNIYR